MRISLVLLLVSVCSIDALAIDRIAVAGQGPNGQGYFYNTRTGQQVKLRGANYIRLTTVNGRTYHSTFSVGYYNPTMAENALGWLEYGGYNVVRVFIDRGDWGVYNWDYSVAGEWSTQIDLNSDYMDNFADFVWRAGEHNIKVIPVLDNIPYNSYYFSNYVNSDPATYQTGNANNPVEGPNARIMALGFYRAKRKYIQSFLTELRARVGGKRMPVILGLALENEASFSTNYAPFNSMSGTVTALDGVTYDMSDPVDRQQAADANLVQWINGIRSAVDALEPDILTTIGAFTFDAIGRTGANGLMPVPGVTDHRYPIRQSIVSIYSNIDFIDIHTYPIDRPTNSPYSLTTDLQSSEYHNVRGPVVMGEFGALASRYPNVPVAAAGMVNHQVSSCAFNFSGWMFWTFDTSTVEQTDGPFWPMQQAPGYIFDDLAPVNRPNPCLP